MRRRDAADRGELYEPDVDPVAAVLGSRSSSAGRTAHPISIERPTGIRTDRECHQHRYPQIHRQIAGRVSGQLATFRRITAGPSSSVTSQTSRNADPAIAVAPEMD